MKNTENKFERSIAEKEDLPAISNDNIVKRNDLPAISKDNIVKRNDLPAISKDNIVKRNDLPAISKDNIVKRNDFIEIKFTGYSDGKIFDSNIQEDLKEISPKSKAEEIIVVVGEGMLVKGLDKALEGKEIGKIYEIDVPSKEGFGIRRRDLVRVIPLKVFTENKINPYPGAVLAL